MNGCRNCKQCTGKKCGKIAHGVIHLPEMPEVCSVYFACRREMKKNTGSTGGKVIVLHFSPSKA